MQPKAIQRMELRHVWTQRAMMAVWGVWGWMAWTKALPWNPVTSLAFVLLCFGGHIAWWYAHRRSIYRQAMAAHYMLCDDCLYDLREVTTPVCPECGKAFTRSSLRRAWLWEAHARRRFRQRWGW